MLIMTRLLLFYKGKLIINLKFVIFQCSVTCGRGHQQRDIKCVDDSGNEQDPSECPRGKPRSLKQCHMGRCPKWYREKWSKVSLVIGNSIS